MQTNREAQRESASSEKRYWLKISNVCNNHCLFCLDEDSRRTARFESPVRLAQEINEAAAQGAVRLVVSGGEPTIHPQFTWILNAGLQAGFKKIQVITNGRMFSYQSFAGEALQAGLTEATFSLHGHTPELHDRLTGVKGSFQQAVRGIANLKAAGCCHISIDIVVNRLNYRYLPAIMHYFIELGVYEFDLLNLIPFGAARKNWQLLSFTYNEALPFLRRAFSLNQDKRCFVWANRFPACLLEEYEELIQSPAKLCDEVLGRSDSFAMYLSHGRFYCEGEICSSCFIRDFCSHFRFYHKPENPGTLIADTAGETLTRCLNSCRQTPEMLQLDLTEDNHRYIVQQAVQNPQHLPGTVVFTVKHEAYSFIRRLVFPSSFHCYLEFSAPDHSIFALPLQSSNAGIIIVLNRAAQTFLLDNQAAFAELAGLLHFRIPVFEQLTDARREYSRLHAVLKCYPGVPVFGAAPCLCNHTRTVPRPVLDLRLSAGASHEQLTALVENFIRHSGNVKSLRCKECREEAVCPGMPVNYIRCFGFKSLKPLAALIGAGGGYG